MYRSSKTYGHDRGLSAVFRQHRATHSHCSKLHGYALSVKLEFASEGLDDLNWVMDFGGLKEVEQFLRDTFDHKLVLAEDDPIVTIGFPVDRSETTKWDAKTATTLEHLHKVADVVVLPAVGCEAFARYVHDWVTDWLVTNAKHSVILESVEIKEHGANGASYSVK